MKKAILFGIVAMVLVAQPMLASTINWTDWITATAGSAGLATGKMGGVAVTYSGDVTFAQTGSGTNYWTEGSPKPYTNNLIVGNAPTPAEMIALSRSGITNTLTFSQAVTNPIMAIVSLGQPGLPVTYDFNVPFAVLSEGRGYWGDGTYTLGAGDVLIGRELHGAIQFNGTFSSISWVASPGEYWHGITIGVPVPEPASLLLLGTGLGVIGLAAWRRRK